MMGAVRIGVVGDFDRGKRSHWATEAALFHAAAHVGVSVEPQWIATSSLKEKNRAELLAPFDGVWGAPGSPYVSMEGFLRAVEQARQSGLPYLGTCGGFQHALIELSRNVLGIADANSAENDPEGASIVITPVYCDVPGGALSPKLNGAGVALPVPGTKLAALCGEEDLVGEYFCSYETNPDFVARWEAAGLRVAARGEDGEMRAFELSDKPFFMATLFQPQLSSSYQRPHPVIVGFLLACLASRARP